jgi:hypothetical protein
LPGGGAAGVVWAAADGAEGAISATGGTVAVAPDSGPGGSTATGLGDAVAAAATSAMTSD